MYTRIVHMQMHHTTHVSTLLSLRTQGVAVGFVLLRVESLVEEGKL